MQNNIIIITGPTASGKSQVAEEVAKKIDCEIINSDSMQVYKEIPITTSSPKEQKIHHLYNIISGEEGFSVGIWIKMVREKIDIIHKKNKIAIIIGGTPMYNRLLVNGTSNIPEIKKQNLEECKHRMEKIGKAAFFEELCKIDTKAKDYIKISDTQRMIRAYSLIKQTNKSFFDFLKEKQVQIWKKNENLIKIKIIPNRDILYKKCNDRVFDMVKNGMIDEVDKLRKMSYPESLSIMKAVGVREVIEYLKNNTTQDIMIKNIQQSTRRYAKHQYTWFRNKFEDFVQFDTPIAKDIINHILENKI